MTFMVFFETDLCQAGFKHHSCAVFSKLSPGFVGWTTKRTGWLHEESRTLMRWSWLQSGPDVSGQTRKVIFEGRIFMVFWVTPCNSLLPLCCCTIELYWFHKLSLSTNDLDAQRQIKDDPWLLYASNFWHMVWVSCFRKLKYDTPPWFCGDLSTIHLGQCRIMESQQKAILRMQETCCKQGTLRMPQGQVGDRTRVCLMRVLQDYTNCNNDWSS